MSGRGTSIAVLFPHNLFRWSAGQADDGVSEQSIFDLGDVNVAEIVDEVAQGSLIRPIPEINATTPPISR
jgi:hypothetical protein